MRVTEEQMFRVVLIVGAAMVPVILLAALVSPLAGAVLFGILVGVGIGALIRRARERRQAAAERAAAVEPEEG